MVVESAGGNEEKDNIIKRKKPSIRRSEGTHIGYSATSALKCPRVLLHCSHLCPPGDRLIEAHANVLPTGIQIEGVPARGEEYESKVTV
jgi:hypothetical protein